MEWIFLPLTYLPHLLLWSLPIKNVALKSSSRIFTSPLFHWPPNCPVPVISAFTMPKLPPAWLYLLPCKIDSLPRLWSTSPSQITISCPFTFPIPLFSLNQIYAFFVWFVGFHTSPKSDEQSVSFYLPTFFSCSHIPISLIWQSSFINALILSAHSIIFKSLSHGLFHRCLSLRPYVIRPYVLLCPNVLRISRWFYTTLPSLFPKQLGMKGLEGLICISPSSHQVPEAYPLYINIWCILCTCGRWVIGF